MGTKVVLLHYSVAKGVEWFMEVLPIEDLGAQYFMSKETSMNPIIKLYSTATFLKKITTVRTLKTASRISEISPHAKKNETQNRPCRQGGISDACHLTNDLRLVDSCLTVCSTKSGIPRVKNRSMLWISLKNQPSMSCSKISLEPQHPYCTYFDSSWGNFNTMNLHRFFF